LGVLLGPLAIQYFFELLQLYQKEYVGKVRGPGDGLELASDTTPSARLKGHATPAHAAKSKAKPPATGGRPPAR
jgi:hypothetical protein